MKILHSWLAEFVALDPSVWTPERIGRVLTDIGLEVEHIDNQAKPLEGFVVGFVVNREKHPNADKLSVCTVDTGETEHRTIVCGAKNVAAGQFVPVALDGATVPANGMQIARRAMRGVESQGMICSRAELKLGDDADGIWILAEQADAGHFRAGMPLAEAIGQNDVIYEVAVTPNRADALSHLGVARDLMAASQQMPDASIRGIDGVINEYPSEVIDTDLCPRYVAHRIDDVRVVESPVWLQDRLRAIGLRPRNNIVDVTNYVMMECGQPLHAFDASRIHGGKITVQRASAYAGSGASDEFTTLDSKQRKLSSDMLLICDQERPLAIAGVMGGENSEITEATTSVVLESATFNPSSVRKTAKSLGISTDASYRFERGVDTALVIPAALRVEQLIRATLDGSTTIPAAFNTMYGGYGSSDTVVHVRFDYVRAILGTMVTNDDIVTICKNIGCGVVSSDNDGVSVHIPSWRSDISSQADIAEEVMRFVGVNDISPASVATIAYSGTTLPENVRAGGKRGPTFATTIRKALVARGYIDCVSNVLSSPEDARVAGAEPVTLRNALGLETSAMRTSLIPGLMRVVAHNMRHGAEGLRLMEIGKVYAGIGQESERLCVIVAGKTPQHWADKQRSIDIYDVLGDTEAALKIAGVDKWEDAIEYKGVVDSRIAKKYGISIPVYAIELGIRKLTTSVRTFVPIATFPAVRRDVAMVVKNSITAHQLTSTVLRSSGPLATDVRVFDVFKDASLGPDFKSVAVAITFRSNERTLVDNEIDQIMTGVRTTVEKELQAKIR